MKIESVNKMRERERSIKRQIKAVERKLKEHAKVQALYAKLAEAERALREALG